MDEKVRIVTAKHLTKEKLWEMTKVIIDALKNAKRMSSYEELDWKSLEGEWFDWLEEELYEDENLIINNATD